jgi:protein-tyrosine-phosphatase
MKRERAALVLDAQSRAGTEVVQALGRAGVAVDIAADARDALIMRSRHVRNSSVQPVGSPALIQWLRESNAACRYELIVPATETSLVALEELDERDDLRRRALLPSKESMAIALSKERTWLLAQQLCIPVPQSRLLTQVNSSTPSSMPVVLKPVQSTVVVAGEAVRLAAVIARDVGERDRQLTKLLPITPVQEQQYVSGIGVGVECLYFAGRPVWHFVHARIHELPLTGGGSTYRKSVAPDPALVAMAHRLLGALQWHGVAMVEFKRSDDGSVYLMEINARLWGSLALAVDAGVNFPLGMWQLACGQAVGPQPRYRVPYYTRHLPSDVNWVKENWKADPADRLLLTRPRIKTFLEFLRPLAFMESWDHFDVRDPALVAAQIGQVVRANLDGVRERLRRRTLQKRLRRQHRRTLANIRRAGKPVRNVLFLCYGNICRSPFAEIRGRALLADVKFESAGFHGTEHRPTPQHVVRAAGALGTDMTGHRSRRLNDALLDAADVIFVMDIDNYERLLREFPHHGRRVLALGMFGSSDAANIVDPYTASESEAKLILQQLDDAVGAFTRWVSQAKS